MSKFNFSSHKKLLIISCIVLVAVIAAASAYFLCLPDTEAVAPVSAEPVSSPSEIADPQVQFVYSAEDAQKLAEAAAKKMFGDDAFVICLGPEPAETDIHGTSRHVYIFGADSRSAQEQSGAIRGLYHIDADTGEIFDNGNGKMEKITIGE